MTIPRHDPANAPGPHDEFWGEQTEWTPQRPPSSDRAGFRARVARWWDALLGGGAVAGRAHGRPAAPSSSSDDPDPLVDRKPTADRSAEQDPVAGREDHDGDDLGDDAWELEPESQPTRHLGVDPLLARLGGLAVLVTLAAPLMVGFTASGSDSPSAVSMLGTITTTPASQHADPTTTVVPAAPASVATTDMAALATRAGPTPDIATTTSPEPTPSDAGDVGAEAPVPSTVVAAPLQDAPEPQPAETAPTVTTAPCGGRYDIATGDYWFRLADAAGVSLAELLAVNNASVDTVLLPGRSICLPVGAATPPPPPPPPPTTAAPAPTAPPAPAAPTQPATTAAPAPTTTVLSRPAAVPQSQAAAIIRQVWPDELEERALEIAWRESNHRSNVSNDCCYGLFQIHWTAHSSWLATIGVTSPSQLFDPVANANAAYTLYQRSGGFGPWGS